MRLNYALTFSILCAILAGGKPVSAATHFYTSSEMVDMCRVAKDPENGNPLSYRKCSGYIDGVFDAVQLSESLIDTKRKSVPKYSCVPDEITKKELILVFLKYMEVNPQQLHLSAALTVHNSIVGAYPCVTR